MYQLNIDWSDFLNNYWQKKPLLIKNAFSQFVDPISPEILAGLAMESEVDSRIVTNHNQNWSLHTGPFDNFDLLTDSHSTLLVQAVNHWYAPASSLLNPFMAIPQWRLDDLMISYSTPKGGVGPHVDQYDVFILQGMGKRHWKVGSIQPVESTTPHPRLLQIKSFEPLIDVILEPGDMLYIPPQAPHEGYAIEPSLNYSIGFRSPSANELLSGFADYVIDNKLGTKRYYDAFAYPASLSELKRKEFNQVLPDEIEALKKMMISLIEDSSHFESFLGGFLSQSRHELDLIEDDSITNFDTLLMRLKQGEALVRLLGIRVLDINGLLYINGQEIICHNNLFKQFLKNAFRMTIDDLNNLSMDNESKKVLLHLLHEGFWHFEYDEESEDML
ncbi:JmjC domain-containing protein [Thorsellia kenyensis]|uniref:JmjC domain-containing protein n=1 Tax=Thorsellia kenyensis TaxID=1549888 RepID=A0ABV6C7M0_9GAMM